MTDNHPTCFRGITPTPAWAFDRYQRIRATLPAGLPLDQQPDTQVLDSLAPLANRFQAFVFDAFGVLNAGPHAFPAAVRRVRELQGLGKAVMILSNAATSSHASLVHKYQTMGFEVQPDSLISSRWVLEQALLQNPRSGRHGVIAPVSSSPETLALDWQPIQEGISDRQLDDLDGFIFLSSEGWTDKAHSALVRSLRRKTRPVSIANPDLVAPRGNAMSLEPGYFGQLLIEQCAIKPEFYGKPYQPAFKAVLNKLEGINPCDILMIGDTLHTDILGGQQAGMKTLLVTAEGALKGMNIQNCIVESGIAPDYVAPEI